MRLLLRFLVIGGAIFVLIQLIPYGRDHANPETEKEPRWDSPMTRALTQQGCFDCHSNLTSWPPWTNVAPISWITYRDVNNGRAALNFSEWQRPQTVDLQQLLVALRTNMPPRVYLLSHPDARLTGQERQQLEAGLSATWNRDPPG